MFAISYSSRLFLPYIIGEMNEQGIHPLIACLVLLLVLGIVPSFFIRETLSGGDRLLENSTKESDATSVAAPLGMVIVRGSDRITV